MVDSGLLAHLLGADERRIAGDDQVTGKLLENFVVTEVLKHATGADRHTATLRRARRIDSCSRAAPVSSSRSRSRPQPQ